MKTEVNQRKDTQKIKHVFLEGDTKGTYGSLYMYITFRVFYIKVV